MDSAAVTQSAIIHDKVNGKETSKTQAIFIFNKHITTITAKLRFTKKEQTPYPPSTAVIVHFLKKTITNSGPQILSR